MITKLKKATTPYEQIDRETIQAFKDPIALAIWVYLLSKPENWEVNTTEIKNHFNISEAKRLKAFKEMRELGLYEVKRIKDNKGQFISSHFFIYPQLCKSTVVETDSDITINIPIQKKRDNKAILPKDIISAYKENISTLQDKIKESKSFTELVTNHKNNYEEIIIGIKNYSLTIKDKEERYIKSLLGFLVDKTYKDYQETNKSNPPKNVNNIYPDTKLIYGER